MSSLVDCASIAAALTTSVARRFIRVDANSSAAVAATSTLPNASWNGANRACRCAVVSFDVADNTVAVDFIAATLSATVLLDALAEPGDGLLNGAARFLLAQ